MNTQEIVNKIKYSPAELLKYMKNPTRRSINKVLRAIDQSDLFPINGAFNVTERAFRSVNKLERANGTLSDEEYILAVEEQCKEIVNNPKNW
jgi:hypothetical protein